MNVLVLVGSLRTDSLNRRLARAAVAHLPAFADVQFFDRLGELPLYTDELDGDGTPEPVVALREAIGRADALLVVTPEYNGLLSGVLKNAIDWASRPRGAASLSGTPTAVLSATPSPRAGQWARESAARSLGVAGAEVLEPTVGVGSAHSALDGYTLVDTDTREAVVDLMSTLVRTQARAA